MATCITLPGQAPTAGSWPEQPPDLSAGTSRTKKSNRRAKTTSLRLRFNKLKSSFDDWTFWVFADAAFALLSEKTKSSEGRFLLLVNERTLDFHVINWKAGVIAKVCNDVKTAETHAMMNAISEAVYVRDVLKQAIGTKVKIKVFTDSNSLRDSIHSTNLAQNKMVRLTIASIKQLLSEGDVNRILWVPTKFQLADILTKKGVCPDLLRSMFKAGKLNEFFNNTQYLQERDEDQNVHSA